MRGALAYSHHHSVGGGTSDRRGNSRRSGGNRLGEFGRSPSSFPSSFSSSPMKSSVRGMGGGERERGGRRWREMNQDPVEVAVMKRESRKRQRKEERETRRKSHVDAQARWSAERRALREERNQMKKNKRQNNNSNNTKKMKKDDKDEDETRVHMDKRRNPHHQRFNLEGEVESREGGSLGKAGKGKTRREIAKESQRGNVSPTCSSHSSRRSSASVEPLNTRVKRMNQAGVHGTSSSSPSFLGSVTKERERDNGAGEENRKRDLTHPQHDDDDTNNPRHRHSSGSVALSMFSRASHHAPPALLRLIHRCFNKLALSNAMEIIKDIAEVLQCGGVRVEEEENRKKENSSRRKEREESGGSGKRGKKKKHTTPTASSREHDTQESVEGGDVGSFIPVSRDVCVSCVMEEISYRASLDSTTSRPNPRTPHHTSGSDGGSLGGRGGFSTFTACIPVAALLRGLQLVGGEMVVAHVVESISIHLYSCVAHGEEGAGSAWSMLLALLYRLYGVDVVLMSSVLREWLQKGEEELQRFRQQYHHDHDDDSSSSIRLPYTLSASAVCAASCALTLLRSCGEKLFNEMPTELDELLHHANQVAEGLSNFQVPSTSFSSFSSSSSTCARTSTTTTAGSLSIVGSARFLALVRVMREMIRKGGGSSPKKKNTRIGVSATAAISDEDADSASLERMMNELKRLLPSYPSSFSVSKHPKKMGSEEEMEAESGGREIGREALTPQQDRLLTRVIQTSCRVEGVPFHFILSSTKPPRWWAPGVLSPSQLQYPSSSMENKDEKEELDDEDNEEEEEDKEEKEDTNAESEDDETPQRVLKLKQIKEMRAHERALLAQRFHTESTRTIFRCLTSATDDLGAFSMLLRFDPTYQHFSDVCRVALQCCVQEKVYNSFYADLLERFCHARRACRRTLQFALWDYFQSVRLSSRPDMIGFINIACSIAAWLEHEVMDLTALRGLDLDQTNKMIGLLARVILLRIILFVSPKRLITLFFGGDGHTALDFKSDTTALHGALKNILELYFVADDSTPVGSSSHSKKKHFKYLPTSFSSASFASTTTTATHSFLSSPPSPKTKWLHEVYDVVAVGTPFDIYAPPTSRLSPISGAGENGKTFTSSSSASPLCVEESFTAFRKRVEMVRKALNQGIL